MMRFRPLTGLFLALCLALTSVSLAVARGQPPMTQWVELCGTDDRLALDADGRPAGPVHLCPDCVAAFAVAGLPVPQGALLRPRGWTRMAVGRVRPSQWEMPVLVPEARGPPPVI